MNEITTSKFLSPTEIEALKESLILCGPRERLIFSILLETGCRGCELRDLRLKDLNLEAGTVQIRGKKRGLTREIPLSKELMSDLVRFTRPDIGDQDGPIFAVSESGLKKLWYKIRPVRKGVHALRHSFAVYLYEKTGDIRLVQLCMGHRSISSTMVYANFVDSKSKIQKALHGGLYA